MDSTKPGIARKMFDLLTPKERDRVILQYLKRDMETILTDLANLHDEGHERFWLRIGGMGKLFEHESRDELTRLREELRKVWKPQTKISEKDRILIHWLQPGGPSRRPAIVARFEKGAILPNPFNLRAMLAVAVLDRTTKLAQCHNPDCPVPFFVGRRKNQKYCERGDCTTYAQRQYALDWWKRNQGSSKKNGRRRKQ